MLKIGLYGWILKYYLIFIKQEGAYGKGGINDPFV